jgi:hypothetical protein
LTKAVGGADTARVCVDDNVDDDDDDNDEMVELVAVVVYRGL